MDYHVDKDQTAEDVLGDMDLTGKRVLVTGAGGGWGLENFPGPGPARCACRWHRAQDLEKGRAAIANILAGPSGSIELIELDLASLQSVRQYADSLFAWKGLRCRHLQCRRHGYAEGHDNGWVRNAVRHQPPRAFSAGEPNCFTAPLRLTRYRAVIYGSPFADIDLDDPNFDREPYDAWTSYGAAKTANVLFAVELDKRLQDRGVRVAAVHPGVITDTSN